MQEKEIIFGAPGCGKTKYLMDVLTKELRTVAPERIAFVSFTKKGAEEGKNRAKELFNYPDLAFKYFRTIHSICFRELKISMYDMMSRKDYKVFSDAMGMRFVGYYTEDFFHNDDRYLHAILLRKNNEKQYDKVIDTLDIDVNKFELIENNYELYKKKFKKYDFTDLLAAVWRMDINLDIDVAIIDEAQDLTTLQWKACETLFKKAKRVYIAGDDDQAIYEWTGADVEYFLGIEGKRTILHKSWRLKKNLLEFSNKISGMIQQRVDKDFAPLEDGGVIKYYNSVEEIEFNPEESYYCLARNNAHLKIYCSELKNRGLVYWRKTKLSVSTSLIKAINNFELYKTGLLPEEEAIYVKKYLRRDVKRLGPLRWYEGLIIPTEDILYYRQLIKNNTPVDDAHITVSTIHGVKGGEADNVVLLLDVSRTVFKQLELLTDSELRCLYVACTRAKTNIHIVHASTKYSYNRMLSDIDILQGVTV